ncbi:MAG: hypothetical protein ABIS03_09615 [Gemmatimonadaceae bacterium]
MTLPSGSAIRKVARLLRAVRERKYSVCTKAVPVTPAPARPTILKSDFQLTNHDHPATFALVRPARRRPAASAFLTPVRAMLLVALLSSLPALVTAQRLGGSSEVFVGSEFESYLRYLQTLGKSDPTVWGLRALGPAEVDALAPQDARHPWAERYSFSGRSKSSFELDYIRPTVGFTLNSSYPFGSNDGPIWAGKGLTSWAQAGVAMRFGPFSAKLAPIAFRAENSEFSLMPNGQTGNLVYADGQFPQEIDKPQRFGDLPYSRIDLGESVIRVDVVGLTAGLSSESQWLGPTIEYPYVLGNNAGGFPHAFVGTSKPVPIGFGHLHGRVTYGYLQQSEYSPVIGHQYFDSFDAPGTKRFMAALSGVLQINGIRGFEVGGARFFHSAIDSSGLTSHDLSLPFQNFLKNRLPAGDTVAFGDDRSLLENQLAMIYFRWAPPRSGFELYGEYGREDFSADIRDFLLEPDHSSTINLGFRKAWLKGEGQASNAIRAEIFTYDIPAGTRNRGEGLIYLHQPLRQGHTNRGQQLGAPTGVGSGSAQLIAFERFLPTGRIKAFSSRVTQGELSGRLPPYTSGPAIPDPVDAQYSIGGEYSRFVGPLDITGRLVLTSELNRHFATDQSNANFALIIRQGF